MHFSEVSLPFLSNQMRVNLEKIGTVKESKINAWKEAIQSWLKMIEYLNCLHVNCNCDINSLQSEIKIFIASLRQLKTKNHVSPYVHSIYHHLPDMIKKFDNIKQFSTSAQELKNSVQTMQQFRSSNQNNVPTDLLITQLLNLHLLAEDIVPLQRSNTSIDIEKLFKQSSPYHE
jgi:hypothetical protein